jgi:large subunit ribosomal protein L15
MKIHELPGDPGRRQERKRVGRGKGSGQGGRAGKGNKGSKARSGGVKNPLTGFVGGQVPLVRSLPKRGFTSLNKVNYQIVNVGALNAFADGATVNVETLADLGLVSSRKQPVKILGVGALERKKLAVEVERVSGPAAAAIQNGGGSLGAKVVVGKKRELNAPRRRAVAADDAGKQD